MNLLCTKLKDIFLLHPSYNHSYTFEGIYPYLRLFLIDSIKKGDKYIDPNYFSLKYSIDMKFSRELFLSLSNHDVLTKFYNISCDSCGETTISKDLKDAIQCVHCNEMLFTINGHIDPLNNVAYLFNINPDIRNEMRIDLKDPPSSVINKTEEGTETTTYNEPTVFDCLDEERRKIYEAFTNAVKETA